jgi:mRNA-degrading endonuclease HigB of HigAB toxin-antitoxin module
VEESAELKGTFGSADLVDRKTVFNVGGNKFRLIGMVDFEGRTVLVAEVMTHAEYTVNKGGDDGNSDTAHKNDEPRQSRRDRSGD